MNENYRKEDTKNMLSAHDDAYIRALSKAANRVREKGAFFIEGKNPAGVQLDYKYLTSASVRYDGYKDKTYSYQFGTGHYTGTVSSGGNINVSEDTVTEYGIKTVKVKKKISH